MSGRSATSAASSRNSGAYPCAPDAVLTVAPRSRHPVDETGAELRRRRLCQVHNRDPQAEGRFWYSVVTTGVYCRPTCPSRRAKPENIRLHDTLADARATGFRPCGRCHPEAPSLGARHRDLVREVCATIDKVDGVPSTRDLAAAVGLSPSQLYRVFRRVTGTTPCAYAQMQDRRVT